MSPNHLSSTNRHERTAVSTVGETAIWLETMAVGDSAEVATYLQALLSSRGEAKGADEKVVLDTIDLLTGQIARIAEKRHDEAARDNGGILPAGDDGTAMPHEVSKGDIAAAVETFLPSDIDRSGPTGAIDVLILHDGLMNFVQQRLETDDTAE